MLLQALVLAVVGVFVFPIFFVLGFLKYHFLGGKSQTAQLGARLSSLSNQAKEEIEKKNNIKLEDRVFLTPAGSVHAVCGGNKKGELVLLIHGYPECWHTWKNQIPALIAAGYFVAAVDLRGYGLSMTKPTYTPEQAFNSNTWSQDLVAVIKDLGYETAHVAGHDWGGLITWHFISAHRSMIKSAVILNSFHPKAFIPFSLKNPSQFLRSFYLVLTRIPNFFDTILKAFPSGFANRAFVGPHVKGAYSPLDVELRASNIAANTSNMLSYYRYPLIPLLTKNAETFSKIESFPVLILWGDEDVALDTRLGSVEVNGAYVRDLKAETLPGVGHFLPFEAPQIVNQKLVDWFKKAPTPN